MSVEGYGASLARAAVGADLGGSSNYSAERSKHRPRTEVEEGSSSTAFERGSVDPKFPTNVSLSACKSL